jgi:hypothetical protein
LKNNYNILWEKIIMKNIDERLSALKNSVFRNRFHLSSKDIIYIQEKGIETIERHAREMLEKRLKPKVIPNDGKQTPMKGHPVFVAQHATATCCRDCLKKWHKIEKDKELNDDEMAYCVSVIMKWINGELKNTGL